MSAESWKAITDFGSSALMLPAAAVVVVWLVAAGAAGRALVWTICFVTAVAIVTATKIAFLGWGIGIRSLDFTGISGHTMLTTAVVSVIAHLSTLDRRQPVRAVAVACGLAAGLVIGISRLKLGVHSFSEVAIGFLLGAAVLAVFELLSRNMAKPRHSPLYIAVSLLLLVVAMPSGPAGEAHGLVVKVALWMSGREEPFSRAVWHQAHELSRQVNSGL